MTTFTIFPAIDLRQGQVVRLQYGDPQRQTTFSVDPRATAQRWADEGAAWLHVVNLDGAFDEGGAANWEALTGICRVGPSVQFGGGIRSLDDVQRAQDAGASRVILGTIAVENQTLLQQAVSRFGEEAIVVALDARDGVVRTRGWQADAGLTVVELGRRVVTDGVTTVIHTDIGRDGVLTGVNAPASGALARETGLQVIASGGVASLQDVHRALAVAEQGVVGLIAGRALYDGKLDLSEALRVAEEASC
jgi:phosphoribosylformimino-5-aminoimidazole carboxamide ribotide isomerase